MAKNKRARTKYPALKPELNLKTRYDLIDYDYIDKLDDSEKRWLNKFTEEYTNATLDRVNLSNNLHNTKELKQDCDRRNNARNRDVVTRAKACGNQVYIEDLVFDRKIIAIHQDNSLDVIDGDRDDFELLLDVADDGGDNFKDTSS